MRKGHGGAIFACTGPLVRALRQDSERCKRQVKALAEALGNLTQEQRQALVAILGRGPRGRQAGRTGSP